MQVKNVITRGDRKLEVLPFERVIRGATVIKTGPTRDNRFIFSEAHLNQIVSLGAFNPAGFKCNFGHQAPGGDQSALSLAGVCKNLRKQDDRVLCDIEFSGSAALSPLFQRDPVPAALAQAHEHPETFGLSMIMEYAERGQPDPSAPLAEFDVTGLKSIDLVGDPAGGQQGLLSTSADQKGNAMSDAEKLAIAKAEREKAIAELAAYQKELGDPDAAMQAFLAGTPLEKAKAELAEKKRLEEAALAEKKREDEKAAALAKAEAAEKALAELQAKTESLAAEKAKLTAELAEAKKAGTPVKTGEPGGSAAPHATFHEACLAVQNENPKLPKTRVIELAAARYPDLEKAAKEKLRR